MRNVKLLCVVLISCFVTLSVNALPNNITLQDGSEVLQDTTVPQSHSDTLTSTDTHPRDTTLNADTSLNGLVDCVKLMPDGARRNTIEPQNTKSAFTIHIDSDHIEPGDTTQSKWLDLSTYPAGLLQPPSSSMIMYRL